MSIYINGKTWWIRIYHQGGCLRESTGTSDKKEAQRFHDERKAKLWTEPKHDGRSWHDAVIAWLAAGERSESDRYSLRALNKVYADRPLSQCTPESFTMALSDKTPATFNRHRALVVAILNMANSPIKIPTKKVKKGRLRFLTKDEWGRLYEELPTHLKPLAKFAVTTGLRQYNVTHLRWSEVDIPRQMMWVHHDEAKSGKAISIPLSEEALSVLTAQNQHKDRDEVWVFPYKGRGRASSGPVTEVKTAWKMALERAGLGDYEGKGKDRRFVANFTWHGLRHTWASWHVMSGTPLNVLQKLGAWEDERMVQNYAHLASSYLASFAGNAKPWEPPE